MQNEGIVDKLNHARLLLEEVKRDLICACGGKSKNQEMLEASTSNLEQIITSLESE